MILIADSGSSKTSWLLLKDGISQAGQTSGINPFFQSEEEIYRLLSDNFLLEHEGIREIWFYGAGCSNADKKNVVLNALERFFHPQIISVESDLLGAARSLCGHEPGIAAILGTGSNSCYYNGKAITKHVAPLGYVLGDEGSGAALGKQLVSDILKRQLPKQIISRFEQTYQLTTDEILNNVYKNSFPNRYLAQFSVFLYENRTEECIRQLVKRSFVDFFVRNIRHYHEASSLPVHFTGSIAWHFQPILKEAATQAGFCIGQVTKEPMAGLAKFHSTEKTKDNNGSLK
ncbi:ATPase [Geofilum sp. OHC36d9]|uniref:ATPase n=1 Tax=Geofilum sp. OHC36d9 TaxID=3458413 RepID=UPI0040335007